MSSSVKKKPIYSDYHFLPDMKIEVLPGDQIGESLALLVPSDRLILVARPIGTKYVANRLRIEFAEEFKAHVTGEQLSIEQALTSTIKAFNTSLIRFLGNPELAPESGAMLIIVYIDPHNRITFAQVGPINLRIKVDKRYVTQTDNHTFSNPEENKRLVKPKPTYNHLPSRFLGHPCWNLIDEDEPRGLRIISAKPFIKTIAK